MSLLGFPGSATATILPNTMIMSDERGRWRLDQWNVWDRPAQSPFDDAILWPRTRMVAGDQTAPLAPFGQDVMQGTRYESISTLMDESGSQGRLKIRGITRDSNGNPLGSVLVEVYLSASFAFVSSCYSDAGGYYEVCTQYPSTNHFIVAYKAGSPDVAGTSVNTLQPS